MEGDEEVTEESDGDARDTLVKRFRELDDRTKPLIERMEKVRNITRTAQDPGNLESPDGGSHAAGNGRYGGGTPDLLVRTQRDPYEDLASVKNRVISRADLRARALDAVELEAKHGNLIHDHAENATVRVQENLSGGIARHMLLTGSQEYQDTFREYIEDPQGMVSRAALSLTLANGGYLPPFVPDPTTILPKAASANPWRRISNIKTTTSNTWNGVNSAGVTAAWLAEGTIVTDNTPTVANVVVTPQKAAAWVFGSYEVLEDTDFGQQLPALLADAEHRLEQPAVGATHTGSVPTGHRAH